MKVRTLIFPPRYATIGNVQDSEDLYNVRRELGAHGHSTNVCHKVDDVEPISPCVEIVIVTSVVSGFLGTLGGDLYKVVKAVIKAGYDELSVRITAGDNSIEKSIKLSRQKEAERKLVEALKKLLTPKK